MSINKYWIILGIMSKFQNNNKSLAGEMSKNEHKHRCIIVKCLEVIILGTCC